MGKCSNSFSETTNNCRGPSNDHSWADWLQLSKWFQRRSVLKHFPHVFIGWSSTNYVFCSEMKFKMAATAELSLTLDPMGKMLKRKFVEDLPMIIPGQFGFNCPSGFREEAF
jgi:hypothetical protein